MSAGQTKRRAKGKGLCAGASFCLDFLLPFLSSKKEEEYSINLDTGVIKIITVSNFT
jgi:hypothetical protein